MKIIQLCELKTTLDKVAYDTKVNKSSYLVEHNGLRIGYFMPVQEPDEAFDPFRGFNSIGKIRSYYSQQRAAAKRRGIEWFFNFATWVIWWHKALGFDWPNQRSNTKGTYCMARKGDKGPYAPWNVECKLVEDNHKDRTINGLTVRGEQHHCNKLTEEQVREIYKSSDSHTKLSNHYNVNRTAIHQIKHRLVWKHITAKLGKPHINVPGRPKKSIIQTI